MKLADWLFENSMTPGQLRRMLDVSRSTIHRYLTNKRIPAPPTLARITEITKGAVTLADFLDPAPPKCARVVRRRDGTERWIFTWSGDTDEPSKPRSGRLSGPLLRAVEVLDGRAWYTPKGRFLLDGRLSDPKKVVAAANEILRQRDEPVIRYPIVEPIHD